MRCDKCDKVLHPFNYCTHLKQPIKAKHSELIGCNIDGVIARHEEIE